MSTRRCGSRATAWRSCAISRESAGTDREAATPKRLIVNADDFGISESVNGGILAAVKSGTVTALSLLVNAPGWNSARAFAASHRALLDAGLHLNLTFGQPVAAGRVPSLVDEANGGFLPLGKLAARALAGRILTRDVRTECEAQIRRATEAGFRLTHLDSHQHVHALPTIAPVVLAVARAAGIGMIRRPTQPLRSAALRGWPRLAALNLSWRIGTRGVPARGPACPHVRGLDLRGAHDFLPRLLRELEHLPTGVTELVVHPGRVDGDLRAVDSYTMGRELELEALLSPLLAERLSRGDIQLIGFSAL